jgi:hypothetical protein
MNKEQIIDEAYENYEKEIIRQRQIQKEEVDRLRSQGKRVRVYLIELLIRDEFINKCKTNPEFSEKWGLKIEERELSWEERSKLLSTEQFYEFGFLSPFTDIIINYYLNQKNIPTKLITITYNDKTIESYES